MFIITLLQNGGKNLAGNLNILTKTDLIKYETCEVQTQYQAVIFISNKPKGGRPRQLPTTTFVTSLRGWVVKYKPFSFMTTLFSTLAPKKCIVPNDTKFVFSKCFGCFLIQYSPQNQEHLSKKLLDLNRECCNYTSHPLGIQRKFQQKQAKCLFKKIFG